MIRLELELPAEVWSDLANTLQRRARHPLTRPDRKLACRALRELILVLALGLPPAAERRRARAERRARAS